MKQFPRYSVRAFLMLAIALPALLVGCGDDDNPADPGNGDGETTMIGIGRGTIDSLIGVYFPEVYSNRDSAQYDAMLDSRYTFQKLPDDPDKPVIEFWNEAEEMKIAGRMFRGTPNDQNQSVESITMTISVGTKTASSDPDEPGDEEWFDVKAIIDLTVVINNPNNTEDPITNFLIDSDQNFVVTHDKNSPGDWVIVKQADRERINRGVPGTEETSWSEVKELFRVVSSGIEDASWSDVKELFRGDSSGTKNSTWGDVKELFR